MQKNLLRHDGAQYCPAVQPNYAQLIGDGCGQLRTDERLTKSDLHLLNGRGIASPTNFLYAVPHLVKRPNLRCMVSTRAINASKGIFDSGGFQISTGKLVLTESYLRDALVQSEEQEAAPIVDAPTSAIGKRGTGFYSAKQCLEFTTGNGLYYIRNRNPGRTKLLNVMQGRSRKEARAWRNGIKHLNDRALFGDRALDGWAFEHLVVLRDEGYLGNDLEFTF
jgi:hypothetical protein